MLAMISATPAAASSDTDAVALNFEPWSNRLLPSERARLDRLAEQAGSHPEERLQLQIPQPADRGARQFVSSRVAAVEAELGKRGLVADRLWVPAASADGALVLRLASPPPERTPVTILPSPAPAEGKPASPAATGAESEPRPIPLIPAGAEAKPGPAAATAEAPPPAVPAPPSPAAAVEELWIAASGRMLRDVLREWGDRAGWTVVWQSDHEYPLDASATFAGDFTTAASQLVEGFAAVAPAPLAHFYKGNRVVLVQSGEGR